MVEKVVPYCRAVVNHPKLSFGLALAAHLTIIFLTALLHISGYDIVPADFSQVPLNLESDDAKLRADAWNFADQDARINLNAASLGVLGPRTARYDMLQLVYELNDGNVFSKENLELIQKTERKLFLNAVYQQKLCLLMQNGQCKPPTSIIRFFDGSYRKFNPLLYDPEFNDISQVLNAARAENFTRALLDYHLGKVARIESTTATSPYTRSFLTIGFPFEGFTSAQDRPEEQWEVAQKHSGEAFAEPLEELHRQGVGKINFYYSLKSLFFDAGSKQVIFDLMLVTGSFAFIFIFMLIQTQSLWITGWGLFGIFSCFFGANIVYRIVFDFRYIGIFHVLSVFIILGIGADDVFVFYDTWRETQGKSFPDLVSRFSHAYSHAIGAMFITSFTTMVAFISNMVSPLLGVSSFGTFSAILVFVNYCSVVFFFPTVVITHELYWKDWKWPCCKVTQLWRSQVTPSSADDQQREGETAAELQLKEAAISSRIVARFFGGFFCDKLVCHRIVRWIILGVFMIFICLSVVYAIQIEADEEEIDMWKPGTNWHSVKRLQSTAFVPSSEDNVINLYIVWGLKNQDRSDCHFTDFKCKGTTVLDRSFDLNPPPCQMAMLDFCRDLKSLNAETLKELKIRTNAVTGEPDVKCFVEDMNKFFQNEAAKSKYPNDSVFTIPVNSQKIRAIMQFNPDIYNMSQLSQAYYRYFEIALGYWLTRGNTSYNNDDFLTYGVLLGGQVDPTEELGRPSFLGGKYGNNLLYAAVKVHTTMTMGNLGFKKGLLTHDAWEKFINKKMNNMPHSCNNAFQATPENLMAWHWIKVQQVLVQSAVKGILLGLSLTLPLLIIMTTNWIVALMCCLTITLITVGVIGIIPLAGWKLGILESLNLTLVVGLAVDYVVHLADGYVRSQKHSRRDKVRHTLGHVGISVLSGACTTIGASIFMLFAKILFFFQFGIFMFCTIGLSIFYALFFFTTAMALFGPEGNTGSILPLVQYVKNKFFNRKSTDVTCQNCNGRGFHEPTTPGSDVNEEEEDNLA